MRPDELERRLRERLDGLGPAPRTELLHVLLLLDSIASMRSALTGGNPKTRAFGDLLIDCGPNPSGGAGRHASRRTEAIAAATPLALRSLPPRQRGLYMSSVVFFDSEPGPL